MDEEEEEEYDDMGDMGEEEVDMGPTVEELIERAQAEQSRLQDANEALQKKVRTECRSMGCGAMGHGVLMAAGSCWWVLTSLMFPQLLLVRMVCQRVVTCSGVRV